MQVLRSNSLYKTLQPPIFVKTLLDFHSFLYYTITLYHLLTMPLQAQPATEADAARAIAIEMVAYGKHPLSSILFPGPPPPPDHPSSRVNFLISQLRESPDNCKWYKVVDTDLEGEDSMIAFSMWYTYATPKTKQTTPREWGPGTNPEVCEAYFGGMTSNYEQKWANKAHMCTYSLLILQQYDTCLQGV